MKMQKGRKKEPSTQSTMYRSTVPILWGREEGRKEGGSGSLDRVGNMVRGIGWGRGAGQRRVDPTQRMPRMRTLKELSKKCNINYLMSIGSIS